jgi:hypothetical protein
MNGNTLPVWNGGTRVERPNPYGTTAPYEQRHPYETAAPAAKSDALTATFDALLAHRDLYLVGI